MDGSRVKVFSQETEAKGQHSPRIGVFKPKLHSRSHVQDAQDSLTSLPIFIFQSPGAAKRPDPSLLNRRLVRHPVGCLRASSIAPRLRALCSALCLVSVGGDT